MGLSGHDDRFQTFAHMTSDLPALLKSAYQGHPLTQGQMRDLISFFMSGTADPVQISGALVALALRGETAEEIAGAATAMRAAAMVPFKASPNAIDVCGTGGDGSGSLNISTAVAFVLAGAGVPVAKHGNRAQSSQSGAADVLAALGLNLEAEQAVVEAAFTKAKTAFMLAPRHHPAMGFVGPVRQKLGIRTLFNLLGPLCNPAGVGRQLLGVFSPDWLMKMGEAARLLGSQAAWLVHGDGLDELTITGPSQVVELKNGALKTFEIAPTDAGLGTHALADLAGGDAAHNAAAMRALFDGKQGAYRDAVLLNAAAGLIVAGEETNLKTAAARAAQSIDTGAAGAALTTLIDATK